MKVILINPPPPEFVPARIITPPLGLAYLSAGLKSVGIDVKVIDADALDMPVSKIADTVARERPDVVGVTAMTPTISAAYQTLEAVRPYTDALVIGGAHPSAVGEEVFESCPADLDAVFCGEAEESFKSFAVQIMTGKKPGEISLPGMLLPGLVNDENQWPRIKDLDSLPFPDRAGLPGHKYRHPLFGKDNVTAMMTSRGCPYRCIFCDKHVCGATYRARSPENVISEIEQIVLKEGVTRVIIYDDLFTLDKKRVMEICGEIVGRDIKFKWKCEGRVNRVDREMLGAMARAGCEMIAYGVETINERGLEFLRKDITPKKVRQAFSMTRDAGIKSLGYFMLGIPGETIEDELETVRFAVSLGADYAQFGVLSPFPGTDLYKYALEKGWVNYAPARGPAERGSKRPVIFDGYWDLERLDRITRLAHRKFYFRPKYIMDRLVNVSGPGELFAGAQQGVKLFNWWLKSKLGNK